MPRTISYLTGDTFRALQQERAALSARDHAILRSQIAIARIPAPTGGESRRAEWIAEAFRANGLATALDEAGNVVARAPGASAGAPVVVCAHLDTVFPAETPLDLREEGTRVVGPGICDNGRGLAVMLAIASGVQRWRTASTRPVEFVATTGEEGVGDLRGSKHYFATAPRPYAVIALDGVGDERIVNTALGSRRFRIAYRGPGGHSWSAQGCANPVHAAARCAGTLANLGLPSLGRSALTVSRIGGGLSVNSIPEDAWLEVDARSTSDVSLGRIEREIRAVAEASAMQENARRAPATPAMTYSIDRIGHRPSGETGESSALVVAAIEATRLVGHSPELATASTDANAAIGAGVPAIAIGGGGRGGGAHSSQEWYDNSGARIGVERVLTIVATMTRVAHE